MTEANGKIIQVGKYYYPESGGMETHLYELCNQLKRRYDVRVLVANTSPRTVSEVVDGVPVTRVANFGELYSCPICPTLPLHLSRLNGSQQTLIQLHLPNPMAHFAYWCTQVPGKLVVFWHSDIIRQEKLTWLYEKRLLNLLARADRVVASSPNYVQTSPFLRRFRNKCVVVPLGIRAERFEATAAVRASAEHLRRRYATPLVLFVGRFTYYKGLPVLLQAAQRVNATFLLVGNGPMKREVQRAIAQNGLAHKVFLFSDVSHEELVAYYHACDLFVLPSNRRSEAFGLVQLEAMACDKPVVSTNLDTGVPWVNRHGETGLTVPVNDPVALAAAMNRLLQDAALRQRLGRQARQRVLRHFTVENVTAKLMKVYDELLQGHPGCQPRDAQE